MQDWAEPLYMRRYIFREGQNKRMISKIYKIKNSKNEHKKRVA